MNKIVSFGLALFLLPILFFSFEGNLVSAVQTVSTTPTSTLSFDVTLSVTSELSLTCPSSVAMSSISGLTGGSSYNVADCNVKSNDANGYLLYVKASSSPALVSNSSSSVFFSDYRTTTPEYTWTLDSTASSSFGFSVSSTGAVSAFRYTDTTCGGGPSTSYMACFRALSTSDINVASKSSATDSNGVTTTVAFKAEIGSTRNQPTGSYVAGITITAVNQ